MNAGSPPSAPDRLSAGLGVARFFPAATLLILGVATSFVAANYVRQTNKHLAEAWLEDHASQLERVMSSRISDYADALVHTRALFAATGKVDPELLHKYLASVNIPEKYPGTLGIGFMTRVPRGDLRAFERRMRRHQPGFHVWPEGDRESYLPVTYYEPPTPENLRVIGFDSSFWPNRRIAQDRAIETNLPTATEKMKLIRDTGGEFGPGFVLFLPVYRPGMPTATRAERDRALIGMVHTVFRVSSFLSSMLGQHPLATGISFDIYDGEKPSPSSLLFSLRPGEPRGAGPSRLDRIEVGGRYWTLDFHATPEFGTFWSREGHWIILATGTLVSLLVSLFVLATLRREEMEKELVAQVRRALDARDEFISIAAHELRTPITSLKLQLDMLRRYGPADPARALARFSELGQSQVRRLTELINELLDVTRIQAGRFRLNPRATDLNQLVSDLAGQYRDSAPSADPLLRVNGAPEPLLADVDPLRLGQAVENLLSNALKYGGTKPIHLEVEKRDGRGVIRVRDQGIGIPPDLQGRIFDRFERAVDTDSVSGLGLGLFIAKQIVDAHHGEIHVESTVGAGSTFSIEVPLSESTGTTELGRSGKRTETASGKSADAAP